MTTKPIMRGLISDKDLKQVGRAALWSQEQKSEKSPPLSGTVEINGATYRIAFWNVEDEVKAE